MSLTVASRVAAVDVLNHTIFNSVTDAKRYVSSILLQRNLIAGHARAPDGIKVYISRLQCRCNQPCAILVAMVAMVVAVAAVAAVVRPAFTRRRISEVRTRTLVSPLRFSSHNIYSPRGRMRMGIVRLTSLYHPRNRSPETHCIRNAQARLPRSFRNVWPYFSLALKILLAPVPFCFHITRDPLTRVNFLM